MSVRISLSRFQEIYFGGILYWDGAFLLPVVGVLRTKNGVHCLGKKIFHIKQADILRGDYFLTVNGDSININDTVRASCILYENYFVGCPACEKKYPSLKVLSDSFNKRDFATLMICSAITSFEKFKEHATKNKYEGITFLYDKNSNIFPDGNKIALFPLEILVNKGSIVSSIQGYSLEYQEKYIIDKINIIHQSIEK